MFPVSCCKFWIYWVGVNTKFTTWQLYKTHVLTAITQCNRAHAKYKQEDNGSQRTPETRPQSINIFAQSHHDNDAITLEKNPILSFLKTEWSFKKLAYVIQRCFVQCFNLLKFAHCFWRRFLKVHNVFSLFLYNLPLEKNVALYSNKLESSSSTI